MHRRAAWLFGLSVAVLFGVEACGSDASTSPKDVSDASSGGRGGKASSGGAGGNVEGGVACDTTTCDQAAVQLESALGLAGNLTIKSCCLTSTACGVDPSAFTSLLGANVQLPSCVDPSALGFPPPVVDSGPPPVVTPIRILDGGIIPVGDGGEPILLDPACPGVIVQPVLDMPGCCRPNGLCGGSTHTLTGVGTSVPLECASYDEIAASAAVSLPGVVIPDDPNLRCRYTLGPGSPAPEAGAGAPDAGTSPVIDASAPGVRDAGAPDARPDAAPLSDAALRPKDAKPD